MSHPSITCCMMALAAIFGVGCADRKFDYPDPEIRVQALRETVTRLCSIQPPRHAGNPHSLNVAAGQITQQLRQHGLEPTLQSFVVDGKTYANVVARVGPQSGPQVIVGAHYDGPELLGVRLRCGDAHRHGLLPQSQLPSPDGPD